MEFSVYDNGLYRGQVTWQQADTTGHPASIGQYDVLLLLTVMVALVLVYQELYSCMSGGDGVGEEERCPGPLNLRRD
jgi:hypothetical protein